MRPAPPDTPHDFSKPHTTAITLCAAWNTDPCTVTFDSNGGSAVAEKGVLRGYPVAGPANPTRAHYGFAGWYLANSDTAFDFATPITQDTTLVARWTAIHAITTQANPAAGGTFAPHPEEALPGTALTLTITLDEGETITLTMAVTNAASYQWQVNTGNGWQPCDGCNAHCRAHAHPGPRAQDRRQQPPGAVGRHGNPVLHRDGAAPPSQGPPGKVTLVHFHHNIKSVVYVGLQG